MWYESAKNKRTVGGNNEKYYYILPGGKIPNQVKLLKNQLTQNFLLAYRTEFLWLRNRVALQMYSDTSAK
jgi:hypothetical protein